MRARLRTPRRWLAAAADAIDDRRRRRLIRGGTPARDRVSVFYGHDVPAPEDPVHGGLVKFQELARVLPNERESFNVLYLGSSTFRGAVPASSS
jgi:hypothetical protein